MHRSIYITAALAGMVSSIILAALQRPAMAHCQVPCGIYDDYARVQRLLEDTRTIDKAIGSMNLLAGNNDAHSVNQMSRWVMNKEEHAKHIQSVIADYFLAQRVKMVEPGSDGYDSYLQQLADHHAVIVAAMKAKQSSEPAATRTLRNAINALVKYYPAPDTKEHNHSH